MSDKSIDFTAYDGVREVEAISLAKTIINTRRRIQRTFDNNTVRVASRYNLNSTITELNSLLRSVYETYDKFIEDDEYEDDVEV